ncbi:MAG: hypothetical protein FWH01_07980 [Oscillospiraceae bacterium]|nr:hypothetical protein [Oscillospiraceae bacterium]
MKGRDGDMGNINNMNNLGDKSDKSDKSGEMGGEMGKMSAGDREREFYNKLIAEQRAARSAYNKKSLDGHINANRSGEGKGNGQGANDSASEGTGAGARAGASVQAPGSARAVGLARGLRIIKGGKNMNSISKSRRLITGARKGSIGGHLAINGSNGRFQLVQETLWDMEPDKQNWSRVSDDSINAMRRVLRRANRMCIAVVAENPAILSKIEQTLEPYGYDIRTYTDARTALDALKLDPCNLIITMGRLKHMSGVFLAGLAKSAGGARHALLISDGKDGDMYDYINRELINGYIKRPLSKNELIDKVSIIMDR